MNFFLADLLTPNVQPSAAGASAAAPSLGEAGGFAAALAAFRAGTAGTAGGAHGVVLPATSGVQAAGAPQPAGEIVAGLNATPVSGDAAQLAMPAPDASTVLTAEIVPPPRELGASSADDVSLADMDAPAPGAADEIDSAAIAAVVPPSVPVADPVSTDNTDIALTIADEARRPVPLPNAEPETPPSAPLREGRASVAGPPPSLAGAAPALTAETFDAALPRATAEASAPDLPQQAAPAAQAGTAPASQPTVPQAAQTIAATPHVVSVQGSVTDEQAANPTDAGTATTAAPATSTPAASAPVEDVAVPPAAPPAPETDAKAADGALAVLTKDKPDSKPAAPQPAAAPTPAPEDVDVAAPKPAAEAEAAKTAETKPEPAPVDKPAPDKPVAEKAAVSNDPRAQQPQGLTDKPVIADAAKPAQQMHTLPATAIPQIASEVAGKFKQGKTRFEIRLDPPELGRVDVRIEVDTDGRITSRLTVEKSETLDLLKADQRALERALNEAGFKSEQNSLSFALKDDRGGQQKFDGQRFLRGEAAPAETGEAPARLVAETAYRAPMRGPGGFDLRV